MTDCIEAILLCPFFSTFSINTTVGISVLLLVSSILDLLVYSVGRLSSFSLLSMYLGLVSSCSSSSGYSGIFSFSYSSDSSLCLDSSLSLDFYSDSSNSVLNDSSDSSVFSSSSYAVGFNLSEAAAFLEVALIRVNERLKCIPLIRLIVGSSSVIVFRG